MKAPAEKRIDSSGLAIRKSTLPGTGKGLFTRRLIESGHLIIEYKGRITTYKAIQEEDGVNPYVYFVNRNHVIDAMLFPESLARYANDAAGIVTVSGLTNNARFVVVNRKVFLEAITDILPDAEIFVSYGKDYWETIAFNAAVEKSYGTKKKTKKK